MTDKKIKQIADLNDQLRLSIGTAESAKQINGRMFMTQGVISLPFDVQSRILFNVKHFKDFKKDNDPYGERNFGSFTVNGNKIFWKIDYYEPGLVYISNYPQDPKKTVRVLTIMLAGEY